MRVVSIAVAALAISLAVAVHVPVPVVAMPTGKLLRQHSAAAHTHKQSGFQSQSQVAAQPRFRGVAAARERAVRGQLIADAVADAAADAADAKAGRSAAAGLKTGADVSVGVGVSNFQSVQVNGVPVVIAANAVNTRTHLPPPAPAGAAAPCPIAFTFDNPQHTTLQWSVHNAGAYTIAYMPGAVGALNGAGAFVWSATLNVGANDFDVQLIHAGATTTLRVTVFRETYGADLIAGVELEVSLRLRLVDPNARAHHMDMNGLHPTQSHANVPIGDPYIRFDTEGTTVTGTRSDGILELVTGPLDVGRNHNDVPQDWRDTSYAVAQWWRSANTVLGACNGGNSITGVDAAPNHNIRYRLLDDIVTNFNLAIGAAAHARGGLANYVMLAVAPVNAVGLAGGGATNHLWYARCGFVYNAADTNPQVNIDYPLSRYGLIKPAAINNAAPTHFIDLFPAANFPHQRTREMGNPKTRLLKRAQTEALQIVNTLGLYPAHPDVLIAELTGAIAIVLNEVMVQTVEVCESQARQHAWVQAHPGGPAFNLGIGWTKNLRVNMVKSCAQDTFRMLPAPVTAAVMNWWNGAAVGGQGNAGVINGVVTNLMAAATPHTGGFDVPYCTQAPHPMHMQRDTARRLLGEYGRQAFGSHGAWSARYGMTETNNAIGSAGVVTPGNTALNPGAPASALNFWRCVSRGGSLSQIPPRDNKLWERKIVVVESRAGEMPLNQAMLTTANPAVNDGNAHLQRALNLIRAAAGAPNA